MALTSYIDLLPEEEIPFWSNLQAGDRFSYARVRRKNVLLSRKSKKGISQRSLLPDISVAWAGLSGVEKTAWSNAGAECNLNGWRLFVKDYCARRVNDLAGLATPSLLHQSWVGQVNISAPASEAKLIQRHPRSYYVYQKVYGKKGMYVPQLVTEDFALPLILSINYSDNLVECGVDPYVVFYAKIWYSYQGQNLYEILQIPLEWAVSWRTVTQTLSNLTSIVIGYDLYIHLHDLRGDLYFDNIKVTHSGQNWARDPFCKDINQGFTRNFYQIPKHWAAIIASEGVIFETVYKDF